MEYKAINPPPQPTPPVPPVRVLGDYWSKVFADMMNEWYGIHKFDKAPSPLIILPDGSRIILADVMLFEHDGENYYCEVKHKKPTKFNTYGLEQYRFESLLRLKEWARGEILYVIHDYTHSSRDEKRNCVADWYCAEIGELAKATKITAWGPSLVNSVYKRVPIHYWSVDNWEYLYIYLGLDER